MLAATMVGPVHCLNRRDILHIEYFGFLEDKS